MVEEHCWTEQAGQKPLVFQGEAQLEPARSPVVAALERPGLAAGEALGHAKEAREGWRRSAAGTAAESDASAEKPGCPRPLVAAEAEDPGWKDSIQLVAAWCSAGSCRLRTSRRWPWAEERGT